VVGALLADLRVLGEQDATLGENELGAYTFTSKLVRVSWQLLDDSAFDLPTFLARKLGERIGRAQAPYLVSGTGTSQPTGLVTNATAGVTGAVSATAAITYDNLIDLEHSVDPAYRESPRTRYVLSDGALKLIRKLKDADDRPLWVPVPAPGFPATINGFPYTVDNSMAAPAPDGRSIIFGDVFAGLIVRVVQGIQMVRLNERYADFLQTGFFGFARMDCVPDDTAAVKAFVHGAAA
jgi:HK97 family phage major capsid protein